MKGEDLAEIWKEISVTSLGGGVCAAEVMSKSVASARQRMQHYPQAFLQCAGPAAAYGKCIAVKDNVTQHICDKEFRGLKDCIEKAMQKTK